MARMREERVEFLQETGAEEPLPEPAARRAAPAPSPDVPGPAFGAEQGAGARYRVLFEKRGAAALTGHLDLTRLLARLVRRAGFMPIYSSGFHPKADFAFGPALALGMESAGEVADLRLVEEVAPEELAARLDAVASEGVRFKGAARLGTRDHGVGAVLRVADFVALLDRPAPAPLDAAALLARTSIDVQRSTGPEKRPGKRVDVRRFVYAVEQRAPDAVWMRVDCGPTGSARPAEVLAALFEASGIAPEDRPRARFERVALWAAPAGPEGELVAPLDLERLPRRGPAFTPAAPPPPPDATPAAEA
jgi:radical SAM-linked protein